MHVLGKEEYVPGVRSPFRLPGTTASRLALVVLLVATLPLGAAAYLARSLFAQASAVWFRPEVGEELDRGVAVHKAWVKAKKDDFRHLAQAAAEDDRVIAGAARGDRWEVEGRLHALAARSPEIQRYEVITNGPGADEHQSLASAGRQTPIDVLTERPFVQELPIALLHPEDAPPVHTHTLVATFVVPKENLDALERASVVIDNYHRIESQRTNLYSGYFYAFVTLLVATSLITIPLGILLARGVVLRIERLAGALGRVAAGDFSPRVPETGSDEITELSRAFNRMLGEVESSRRKIEFLQRIGAWQEMAKRLAHEIKNPLTPILLAVQECHRKYDGGDARFRALLDTTTEIVEEEVGALRRLVENFSNFARLPEANLEDDDLASFLAEADKLGTGRDLDAPGDVEYALAARGPTMPVPLDRQLLRRVLANLVENGRQAAEKAEGSPKVRVQARPVGGFAELTVEDRGPGVPAGDRERIFEPYVTHKANGTGLGLAIAMKIVVEHGGTLAVDESPSLGGARFTLRLPLRVRS
jgi:nitrogen fixation/metabolism regulation signal transduction histidine kinase